MPVSEKKRRCMARRLEMLYGDAAPGVLDRIDQIVESFRDARGSADPPFVPTAPLPSSPWDERTAVLITYGDQVDNPRDGEEQPDAALEVQRRFLLDSGFARLLSGVHLLPFCPYSSDDGFSVIDYLAVDPAVGSWEDVERFGKAFALMFDFVVNHCSQQHAWFRAYLRGEPPYVDYFIDVDPATDLSAVTRPRSHPLLTPFKTDRGTKHLWTTFSADQVDLNFACPDLLIEMISILLEYLRHGARWIRLDAIGFLWKTIGTSCMHLPETHEVVKLLRDVVDEVAPGTVLITETNVPHDENVSYFGDGDEAHAVYQFSLAPLLLDAFLTGDARTLRDWLTALDYPALGATYFNFTASHDGIGLRPLEGIVPPSRIEAIVDAVRQRGGRVSMRHNADGSESPYELNITFFSALDSDEGLPPDVHARKFLTSQAIMLALRGVPGIYFHSLIGTPNDQEGVERTGHPRAINRRKFQADELRKIVGDSQTAQSMVFDGYRQLLATRIAQPAFHPDAAQSVVEVPHPSVLAFVRTSRAGDQQLLVLANVGPDEVAVDLTPFRDLQLRCRLGTERGQPSTPSDNVCNLGAYETRWLSSRKETRAVVENGPEGTVRC